MNIQPRIPFVTLALAALVSSIFAEMAAARASTVPNLTLPLNRRPEWLRREGIVMAGSWEPLLFRVRRDGAPDYTPTAEQRAAYAREHSPEMVSNLKSLGVNFVMLHGYKGAGLEAERESMADAVKFAKLCHEAGLRVGVYADSGTFMWELFFNEVPQARDWLVHDIQGRPLPYGKAAYRYYWNRNHPDGQAYFRKITRFAVRDIQTDLIHLDNYITGPGYDANSVERFRQYLRANFRSRLLQAHGITNLNTVTPPDRNGTNLLARAWADFCCVSLAEAYQAMSRYARTLRRDIVMECNPAGVDPTLRWAVDHGRLLRGGEAFWDEGTRPGFSAGKLRTRIRTYKAARSLNNSAFAYITSPLEAAESMAFNLNCLGAICWFEYGEIVAQPGVKKPVSPALGSFVDFFHDRRELLQDARVVTDVGVLRSFPSMQFGTHALPAVGPLGSGLASPAQLTTAVEDTLITNRCAFQLVFDSQFDELSRWPCLVLPGCVALSDAQVKRIRRYVSSGRRLCIIGPAATHDEWMLPRKRPVFDDLPAGQVVRVAADGDWLDAVRRACGDQLLLSITSKPAEDTDAPRDPLEALCAELTEQPGRRLVHLVNYRPNAPLENLTVRLALPKDRVVTSVRLASPEHTADVTLQFDQEADHVMFTVPAIGVYEIAIVEYVRGKA
jgi:hypothetical protein